MAECPLCSSRAVRPAARHHGYAYGRCGDCGFLFLNPMPSAGELVRVYNEDEAAITPEHYPKAASRRRRAAMRALSLAPVLWRKDAIDVGCGGGFMTAAMHRLGARATGLDISAQATAYAGRRFPDCRFYCESFADFARRGLTFDFVFTSEVIEHVPDAAGFAAFLAAVARPRARLFLTTPDAGHPAVPDDLRQWDMLAPPRHVHLFNEANLSTLLSRAGFRILRRYRKRAPSLQILAERLPI